MRTAFKNDDEGWPARPGGERFMGDVTKTLNAVMILSWEADGMAYDETFIAEVADLLGLGVEGIGRAVEEVESKRDNGTWGGRRRTVLEQAMERLESAGVAGLLPTEGPVADRLDGLLKRFAHDAEDDALSAFIDDDDEADDSDSGDEAVTGTADLFTFDDASVDPIDDGIEEADDTDDVDPFEELGVGAGPPPRGDEPRSAADDALDALLGDYDDDEDTTITNALDDTADPATETAENEAGLSSETAAPVQTSEAVYTMLLRTVWVDGILDPAEVQLLTRKRQELDITFERHLELVREVVG